MLKLLAFVVCEKVILEKETETASLISVVQTIKFQAPPTPEVPKEAIAPLRWSVFSVLDREPEDVGKTFRQKGDVILPDGSSGAVAFDLAFVVKDGLNFNVITIFGFPVGQLGTLKVRTWVESSTGEIVVPHHNYPISVEQVSSTVEPVPGGAR